VRSIQRGTCENRSELPAPQRTSMRTHLLSNPIASKPGEITRDVPAHPEGRQAKAWARRCLRIRSPCCAWAESGQTTTALPRIVMHSHRHCLFRGSGQGSISAQRSTLKEGGYALRRRLANVRFTPKSGHVRCNHGCPLWAKSGHGFWPRRLSAEGNLH